MEMTYKRTGGTLANGYRPTSSTASADYAVSDSDHEHILREIDSYNLEFERPVVMSCIPNSDHLKIWIGPDGCTEKTLSEHDAALREKLPGYPLQIGQLKQFPKFEFTSAGQLVTSSGSLSTLGLYARTQDGQMFALSTGHGKSVGDDIKNIQPNDEFHGVVEYAIQSSDPFCDVAVVRVLNTGNHANRLFDNRVFDNTGYCYHQNPVVGDVTNNEVLNVQLFSNGEIVRRRMRLARPMYFWNQLHLRTSMAVYFSGVQEAIHKSGQSGVVLTTSDDGGQAHVIDGLLMLTGIYSIGDGNEVSIGQPLSRILARLHQEGRYQSLQISPISVCRRNCAP